MVMVRDYYRSDLLVGEELDGGIRKHSHKRCRVAAEEASRAFLVMYDPQRLGDSCP